MSRTVYQPLKSSSLMSWATFVNRRVHTGYVRSLNHVSPLSPFENSSSLQSSVNDWIIFTLLAIHTIAEEY